MSCEVCVDIVETPDLPHVVRSCEGCGRPLRIRELDDGGKGLRIRKGDQFVVPAGFIKFSLNPLNQSGQFFRFGVEWFAKQIFLADLPAKKDDIASELDRLLSQCSKTIESSPLLRDFVLDPKDQTSRIIEVLETRKESLEWWAYLSGVYLSAVKEAIEANDVELAVWAMACAERCRALAVFKAQLEEVVWMGQSVRRVVDLLAVWDANQGNSEEAFWQETFAKNTYALGQVFAAPVVFMRGAAYIGGMTVDRQKARLVDYLFSLESSREAAFVEIKTPVTKLLGRRYRGTFRPSSELTGAVAQALDYRVHLMRHFSSVIEDTEHKLSALAPRCVVVAGNGKAELDSEEKRRAFEYFRGNSKDVEVITYDELFRKIAVLANLFGLTVGQKKEGT